MANVLKFNNVIRVAKLASDPANVEEGMIYFNTTSGDYKLYQNGGFRTLDTEELEAHLNGGASKHDASEIDVEAADGQNHTQADLETVIGELDDAIGTLNQGSNYTAGDATSVGSHLDAIDDALASAGSDEFADNLFRVTGSADATKKVALEVDGLTTSTTRTITMPDADVDLAGVAGSVTTHSDVTDAGSGAIITSSERSKLSGIEAGADVTDATNVDAAGATMNTDTDVSGNSWVLDEDTLSSDSATKVPTQQSVKAYVDTEIASAVASEMSYIGGYDASSAGPSGSAAKGDVYTVTTGGTGGGFWSTALEVGDLIIAESASPSAEGDWTVVNKDLDAASIKSSYESNADTNAFTDAEQSKLSGIEASADVTDAANVDAAGAVMESDTSTASMSFVVDEDNMSSDSDTKVPTQQSVKAYADTKLADLVDDTTPELGGDLSVGTNVITQGADGVKRGSSSSDFLEEEYFHSISLTASTTAVASDLTFAHASFEGCIIEYRIKEATTNRVRVGQILVATEGTNVSVSDMFTETGDAGVSWSGAINGANVELSYTTTANAKTMRCDVKRVKA